MKLLYALGAIAALVMILPAASAQQIRIDTADRTYKQYLPVLLRTPPSTYKSGYNLINKLRANAGIAPVSYSSVLEKNCLEHSRYMAENGILAHEQNPDFPYASSSGQKCARQANIWLGSGLPPLPWKPKDVVMSWMSSVSHRIWLLYPTSKVFGFAFYTSQTNDHTAAAIDILSRANFEADEAYSGWPVRYPGSGEEGIPATVYPITLNWRYFGPEPVLDHVRLTTGTGQAIEFKASTQMAVGHKGIKIVPKNALPANKKIKVLVEGSYEGTPFSYSWQFFTGSTQNLSQTFSTVPGD